MLKRESRSARRSNCFGMATKADLDAFLAGGFDIRR
jgi:hypothetical protein